MPGRNLEPENENKDSAPPAEAEADPQPVRELTQTDRLNKRLLQSFLERINQSGPPITETVIQNNTTNSTDDDFS